MNKKILFAGESWMTSTTHVKGFDTFYTSTYEEGVGYIREAIIEAGYEFSYLPNHVALNSFPYTSEELKQYACVILSDIGSNTLLLPDATFAKGEVRPNRCQAIKEYVENYALHDRQFRDIKEYVENGGAFIMIGGYMSFTGIDAKARYGVTAIKDILPVKCLETDDREEHSEGVIPIVTSDHDALRGLPKEWPHFLGYNKTIPIEGCEVPVTINGDPLIAFGSFGKGKSAVFTSDCAPHWGTPAFVKWDYYNKLWKGIIDYITI